MSIKPRTVTEDPDVQLISSFGGLASASYNRTGDIVYQDKLVNAFVNKRGAIVKRGGSVVNTSIAYFDNSTGNGVQRFTFDDTKYMLAKVGRSLVLTATKDNVGYVAYTTYPDVFLDKGANDKPSFAVRIEGSYCHVLVATANTGMVSVTIVKSVLINFGVSTTTVTGTLQVPIAGSVITSANSLLRQDATLYQPATVTHSGGSISLSIPSGTSINTSKTLRLHSFYLLRFVDAQFYPGLYMVNSALRRNQVPLDVNVQVPLELQTNPIVNEPTQLVDRETLWLYGANVKRTKVSNRQPANGNEWDFSDGGFLTGSGLFTNPSPSFVSFGGYSTLSTNGSSTTVQMSRLRTVLLEGLTGNFRLHVDKSLRAPIFHDSNTTVIALTGFKPKYFSFAEPSVNLNLSAVVELTHIAGTIASINSDIIVNLDPNDNPITIGNGYCIPLYGYGFATSDGIYPDVVAFVGNRLVLTGRDARVVFSNADWNYRGISFNNCQISTINFSETSAFSVNLGQGSSAIKGFESVNGVSVVATDTGIFRISSSASASRPANASDAVVSRVSSELLPNGECFTVFDNRIYYASSNGLYSLEYSEQQAELVNQSISENVSNKFTNVNTLSYVKELRSFLITFDNLNEILALNVDTNTYYTLKFATIAKPQIDDSGFYFTVAGESSTNLLVCSFDSSQPTDLSNFSSVFGYSLPGRSLTITHKPTSCNALVCPAELLALFTTAKHTLASGDNHARLIGSDSALVTEYLSHTSALPIDSYMVSKAFFANRLDQSSRIQSISLILAGVGSVWGALVQPTNDYSDRAVAIEQWLIGDQLYEGEPMLNAAFPRTQVRANAGNTSLAKLMLLGISESWQIAMRLNNISLLGLQFNTLVKSRKRLR